MRGFGRFVWCSTDLNTLFWRPVGRPTHVSMMDAASITGVLTGKHTTAFRAGSGIDAPESACLSLIASGRSLDLQIHVSGSDAAATTAAALQARGVWADAFAFLVHTLRDRIAGAAAALPADPELGTAISTTGAMVPFAAIPEDDALAGLEEASAAPSESPEP